MSILIESSQVTGERFSGTISTRNWREIGVDGVDKNLWGSAGLRWIHVGRNWRHPTITRRERQPRKMKTNAAVPVSHSNANARIGNRNFRSIHSKMKFRSARIEEKGKNRKANRKRKEKFLAKLFFPFTLEKQANGQLLEIESLKFLSHGENNILRLRAERKGKRCSRRTFFFSFFTFTILASLANYDVFMAMSRHDTPLPPLPPSPPFFTSSRYIKRWHSLAQRLRHFPHE